MTDTVVVHYGIKRRSGRYPWGSGGEKRLAMERLEAKGFSEKEQAAALGIKTPELRNQKAIAKTEAKEEQRLNVVRQKANGMSIAAIAREFKIPASTVTELLKPAAALKFQILESIRNTLKKIIGDNRFVDVGDGAEIFMQVSRTKLDNGVQALVNEGYKMWYLKQEQLGSPGRFTTVKILGAPDTTWEELVANKANIAIPNHFSTDSGLNFFEPGDAKNISSDKVLVRYKDDGGLEKDGLIEMRAGVPELSLGGKSYAQVRVAVDGTHFMKGMIVARDDLPDGVDFIYNTSKEPPADGNRLSTENKLSAMKPQLTEEDGGYASSVFGAVVKPNEYEGPDGSTQFGPINILGEYQVSEEGAWTGWKKSLASQILSKQSPRLAEDQLKIVYENQLAELNDIMELTHPTVRNHLLQEFADKADKAAVDLQAAALPRQSYNVLLPDPDLSPTEIYAPNYNNGERVAVIRYPHGGVFEIAELTVNNKTSQYRKIIGTDAEDAVAVNPETAQKLSGADFDGDSVLVIPNRTGKIRSSPSLEELKNFDSKSYKIPEEDLYDEKTNPTGIKPITDPQKQLQMGKVSNLITDMTIMGADQSEIARAVRHSMVVIDAEKHKLNVNQSYLDNGIANLKETYQGSARAGAATLISRAKSEERVPARRDYYDIDPNTGEKVFQYTKETYIDKNGREWPRTTKSTKLAEYDPYQLSSGTLIESVYADHSNRMKNLANSARLETLKTTAPVYSQRARQQYADEVASLNAKYTRAVMNRPIQRKVQLLGGEIYREKIESTPNMSGREKDKWKGRSYALANARLDGTKPKVNITPREWEAIDMGAVSKTRLKGILRNADMDQVRQYATPRAAQAGLSTGKKSRALNLIKNGYTNAEVANALGVPVSQIRDLEK
jgi:hypothetical protein